MDKKNKKIMELGKDVLIAALTCSAIYMATDILLPGGLGGIWNRGEGGFAGLVQQEDNTTVVWPVRIAVSSWNGERVMRFGVQYDRENCVAQYSPVASLLREALSDLGLAHTTTQKEWERALSQTSSLYFDLLGEMPFPVLSGWMTGTDSGFAGTVRRLILSAEGDEVTLYYRDEDTGNCYASRANLVTPEQIRAVSDAIVDNGAEFAFELEEYDILAGDTMLLSEAPKPRVYGAANPLAGEGRLEQVDQDSVLGRLLQALSFPENSYIYSGTHQDQVIRSGNDTLRISAEGVVRYVCAEGEPSRYQIPAKGERPTQFEIAQACLHLAEGAAGTLAGEGRLYLQHMSRDQDGWQVDFGYCLDGAAVQVGESGFAARFSVQGSEITQFAIQLRCYTDTGSRSAVLPEQQAAAAMEALEAEGSELMLTYRDLGGDKVLAGWVAHE